MATQLPLFGREREVGVLKDLIEHVRERGGALLVRGEAGIGKSSLLAAASRDARERGMLVLATAGVQSEARLPFAGLHQLLLPVLSGIDGLPGPQRTAMQAAFGMTDAPAPALFFIALAALDLLADTAVKTPVLLIIEDAHWLDRSSADVVAFVARRLEADPIIALIALRDGFDTSLNEAGLAELLLEGLDEAAGALLDAHAPDLAPEVRERVLNEAAGNPLALIELPSALAAHHLEGEAPLPAWLPLTTRLERAFAARMSDLPAATCTLLLVAAVDDGGDLAEVVAAGRTSDGKVQGPEALEALSPAVLARLIEVDEAGIRFRHPLVRSAVYQAASVSERRQAHAALADVLADQPDRRVWHRAASVVGPDEDLAAELEATAARAQRRGGLVAAVAALERAATFTAEPRRRGSRLVHAAELAFELGRRDLVVRLLREAEPLELGALERGRMLWIQQMIEPGIFRDVARVRSLIELADRARLDGDRDLALDLLWLVASRAWWADPGTQARESILAAADRAGSVDSDLRLLAIVAYAGPTERCGVVMDRLSSALDGGEDAESTRLLGTAAVVVGAFDLAAGFLAASAAALRAQGRLGHLARVLMLQAWSAMYLANWKVALPAAEEAGRLAVETREPIWAAGSKVVKAMLAALRGESDGSRRLRRRGRTGRPAHRCKLHAGRSATGTGPDRTGQRAPRRRLRAPSAPVRPGRRRPSSRHPVLGDRRSCRSRRPQWTKTTGCRPDSLAWVDLVLFASGDGGHVVLLV